jgi:hypothetical protein
MREVDLTAPDLFADGFPPALRAAPPGGTHTGIRHRVLELG